jgi:hypothetical protein
MYIDNMIDKLSGNLIGKTKRCKLTPNARLFLSVTEATGQWLFTRYTAETYCPFSPQSLSLEKYSNQHEYQTRSYKILQHVSAIPVSELTGFEVNIYCNVFSLQAFPLSEVWNPPVK